MIELDEKRLKWVLIVNERNAVEQMVAHMLFYDDKPLDLSHGRMSVIETDETIDKYFMTSKGMFATLSEALESIGYFVNRSLNS